MILSAGTYTKLFHCCKNCLRVIYYDSVFHNPLLCAPKMGILSLRLCSPRPGACVVPGGLKSFAFPWAFTKAPCPGFPWLCAVWALLGWFGFCFFSDTSHREPRRAGKKTHWKAPAQLLSLPWSAVLCHGEKVDARWATRLPCAAGTALWKLLPSQDRSSHYLALCAQSR